MWLFTSVSSHVHNQHVLRLERLLFPAALLPTADEHLFVGLDVILIDVLRNQSMNMCCEYKGIHAVHPLHP